MRYFVDRASEIEIIAVISMANQVPFCNARSVACRDFRKWSTASKRESVNIFRCNL